MKKITKIVAVMAVLSTVFIGCKKPDDPVDPKPAEKTDNSEPAAPETPADPTDEETTPTYTTVWEGSCELAWDGGQDIDHGNFTANVKGVKISYSSADGEYSSIKIAVCDPWGDIMPTSATGGTVKNDGAVDVATNKTDVTLEIYFDETSAKKIVGENKDGAWGGLKVYGFGATITKVESIQ